MLAKLTDFDWSILDAESDCTESDFEDSTKFSLNYKCVNVIARSKSNGSMF